MFNQRVMRAAQHRRIGARHAAQQRFDMGMHHRFGQQHVALFNGIDHAAARLRLDIDPDRTECEFALERTAGHCRGGRKQRHMLDRHFARGGIVAPLAFGQRLDQWYEHAQNALLMGHPRFLHPLQRGGRCGVARKDHQIAAIVPQPFHARTGQLENVVRIAHAVRGIRIVTVIDKRYIGQFFQKRAQHGQPAQS